MPFYIIPTPYALCGGRRFPCPRTAHKSYYAKCHLFCIAANVLYGAVAPNPTNRFAPWWLRALSKSLGFRYAPVVFLRATQKRCVLKRASCAALHPCGGGALRCFIACASHFPAYPGLIIQALGRRLNESSHWKLINFKLCGRPLSAITGRSVWFFSGLF